MLDGGSSVSKRKSDWSLCSNVEIRSPGQTMARTSSSTVGLPPSCEGQYDAHYFIILILILIMMTQTH